MYARSGVSFCPKGGWGLSFEKEKKKVETPPPQTHKRLTSHIFSKILDFCFFLLKKIFFLLFLSLSFEFKPLCAHIFEDWALVVQSIITVDLHSNANVWNGCVWCLLFFCFCGRWWFAGTSRRRLEKGHTLRRSWHFPESALARLEHTLPRSWHFRASVCMTGTAVYWQYTEK